ncbi:GAF and ANTAR domain-containing protein [Allokutzneria albata]|uniref:GAF domain-containing protein n=1 Tax=Allokutzneria albata TaxID=211114 RepID=A0A1G9T349_ALLAB|nr:GAF and ANTAR domain-containing protein [Allokutzneria albata]SDM42174.1 GAF domain-containing protein [Allokutzneria albata]
MTAEAEKLLTLAQELAEVSRLVEDDDVTNAIGRFVGRVARTVPGCAETELSELTDEGIIVIASSGTADPLPGKVSGPISEALRYREPRRLDDTRSDRRWPDFGTRLERRGFRSCLTLPLPARRSTAVLTLFSAQPHQFAETAYDIMLLLTVQAGVILDNATLFQDGHRMIEQLQTALDTRQAIGQAQGLVMRCCHCDAPESFRVLVSASQNSNTKLREVATTLVTAHEQDTLANALAKFGIT